MTEVDVVSECSCSYDEPATETMIVPIGPNGGVSHLPICGGFVAGDFFTRMVKSKDLLSGKLFGALNAKVPDQNNSCM
jgi:hypothetical protein